MSAESGRRMTLTELALWLVVRDSVAREGLLGDLYQERALLRQRGQTSARWHWIHRLRIVNDYARTSLHRRRPRNRSSPSPRGGSMLSELLIDLKFSLRTLVRSYGFTAAAVLTLAVGIGAATAMFGVLNTALLRALPYEHPDRLVLANTTFDGEPNDTSSSPDYDDLRAQSESFETFACMAGFPFPVTVTGAPEAHRAAVLWVSWDFFKMLGTDPVLGRHFTPAEGQDGAPAVVMVSHAYWRDRLGAAADAVGATLTLGGQVATVVGVLPPGFRFIYEVEVFHPYRPNGPFAGGRQYHNWVPVGRLAAGVTLAQAQSEVDAIMANLEAEYPDTNKSKGMLLTPLHDALASGYRRSLWVLMGAAGWYGSC